MTTHATTFQFCAKQVGRLKPRFRQFILEGCKAPHAADGGVRSTPLRGRMADVHGGWSARRGQDMEGTRKSLAFEADENIVRPVFIDVTRVDEDAAQPRPNRLQEIRRRMGGLGTREPAMGAAGPSGSGVEHAPSSQADFKPDRYFFAFWRIPVFVDVEYALLVWLRLLYIRAQNHLYHRTHWHFFFNLGPIFHSCLQAAAPEAEQRLQDL